MSLNLGPVLAYAGNVKGNYYPGARGLRNVLETVMLDIMYDLPNTAKGKQCIITKSVIENNEAPLFLSKAE